MNERALGKLQEIKTITHALAQIRVMIFRLPLSIGIKNCMRYYLDDPMHFYLDDCRPYERDFYFKCEGIYERLALDPEKKSECEAEMKQAETKAQKEAALTSEE